MEAQPIYMYVSANVQATSLVEIHCNNRMDPSDDLSGLNDFTDRSSSDILTLITETKQFMQFICRCCRTLQDVENRNDPEPIMWLCTMSM